jgi:hypothetical protein
MKRVNPPDPNIDGSFLLLFGMPGLGLNVCVSLGPAHLEEFCVYSVFKRSSIVGHCPVNRNISLPVGPLEQNGRFVEKSLRILFAVQ